MSTDKSAATAIPAQDSADLSEMLRTHGVSRDPLHHEVQLLISWVDDEEVRTNLQQVRRQSVAESAASATVTDLVTMDDGRDAVVAYLSTWLQSVSGAHRTTTGERDLHESLSHVLCALSQSANPVNIGPPGLHAA